MSIESDAKKWIDNVSGIRALDPQGVFLANAREYFAEVVAVFENKDFNPEDTGKKLKLLRGRKNRLTGKPIAEELGSFINITARYATKTQADFDGFVRALYSPGASPVGSSPRPAPRPSPVGSSPRPSPRPSPAGSSPRPSPRPSPAGSSPRPYPRPSPVESSPRPSPAGSSPRPAPRPSPVESSPRPSLRVIGVIIKLLLAIFFIYKAVGSDKFMSFFREAVENIGIENNNGVADNGDGAVTQDCGGKAYEPEKAFCYEDSVVVRCGGKSYDLSESFCLGNSIYALCGGDQFNPEEQFCFNDSIVFLCNGVSYSLDSSFCYGDSVVALCDGKTYDPQDSVCHEERLFGFFEDSRDGQVYRTVQIGSQTWMAENLNYAYMPDTLSFCYNDSAEYCEKYGRLYMWSVAMDSAAVFSEDGRDCGYGQRCSASEQVRGVCPAGWHLSSDEEWDTLKNFVAKSLFNGNTDSVGYVLKAKNGWYDDGNGSDAFGFGVLPAGGRYGDGTFDFVLGSAYFWSATEIGANNVFCRNLYYGNAGLYMGDNNEDVAMSVRCIKDD